MRVDSYDPYQGRNDLRFIVTQGAAAGIGSSAKGGWDRDQLELEHYTASEASFSLP